MTFLVWLATMIVVLTLFGLVSELPATIIAVGLIVGGVACIVHAARMMR